MGTQRSEMIRVSCNDSSCLKPAHPCQPKDCCTVAPYDGAFNASTFTYPLAQASSIHLQPFVPQMRIVILPHRNMDEVMHTPQYVQPFLMMSLGQTITLDIRYDGVRFAEHERDGGQHYWRNLQQRLAMFHTRRVLGGHSQQYDPSNTPTHEAYFLVLQQLHRLRSTYPTHIEDFLVDRFLHRVRFVHTPTHQCPRSAAVSRTWYHALSFCVQHQGSVVVRPSVSLPPPGYPHMFADALVLRHTEDEFHSSTNGTILQGFRYFRINPPLGL